MGESVTAEFPVCVFDFFFLFVHRGDCLVLKWVFELSYYIQV